LCLFAHSGHDLRELLRGQATDLQISETVQDIWSNRTDHYSELRGLGEIPNAEQTISIHKRVEMSYIGG
jgi:cyclic pyranopterin phosphate synthase